MKDDIIEIFDDRHDGGPREGESVEEFLRRIRSPMPVESENKEQTTAE